MKLIIISGRSGSGKSTCLNVMEDLGFYCVDNIPASLAASLVDRLRPGVSDNSQNIAVSIDARNIASDLNQFTSIYEHLLSIPELELQIIFLDADDNTLLKRFSETRRKHPLSNPDISLQEAMLQEKTLLSPISQLATWNIDTSRLTIYQLRDEIKNRVLLNAGQTAVLFQSFGFKNSLPADTDLLFDARCLPNPYWNPELREYTGLDRPVIDFLASQPEVGEFIEDIYRFLKRWIPRYEASNRSYITVSIGCTGGHHRSVYLCEELGRRLSDGKTSIQVRHRELAWKERDRRRS